MANQFLRFRVSGYKSWVQEAEMSMVGLPRDARNETYYNQVIGEAVMPVSVIYGGHGSGKTNLFDAMRWMMSSIKNGCVDHGQQEVYLKRGKNFTACFAIDFIEDEQHVTYGFSINVEYCNKYGSTSITVNHEHHQNSQGKKVRTETCGELKMCKDSLYFHRFNFRSIIEGGPWFDFLRPEDIDKAEKDIVELARAFDIDICGAKIEYQFGYPILTSVKFFKSWEYVSEQSCSTKRILLILLALRNVLAEGGLLCIDDLNFHSIFIRKLMSLFNKRETNPGKGQLIFTTNDVSLMASNTGDHFISPAQIYLAEKNDDRSSTITPLSDFNIAEDANIQTGYLQGRYGGIPNIFS